MQVSVYIDFNDEVWRHTVPLTSLCCGVPEASCAGRKLTRILRSWIVPLAVDSMFAHLMSQPRYASVAEENIEEPTMFATLPTS